jgi:hypothetical protein
VSACFLDLFTPDERSRWDRLNAATGNTSGADTCWVVRKMYEGVRKVPPRDGGITAMVIESCNHAEANSMPQD